jgi:hypothetical protein
MDARLHPDPALDNAPLQAMLRRRVMEEARPLAQLRDPADEHVALGGMQIAARRINAQRPARAAANSSAARTSSRARPWKSRGTSSSDIPPARVSRMS